MGGGGRGYRGINGDGGKNKKPRNNEDWTRSDYCLFHFKKLL